MVLRAQGPCWHNNEQANKRLGNSCELTSLSPNLALQLLARFISYLQIATLSRALKLALALKIPSSAPANIVSPCPTFGGCQSSLAEISTMVTRARRQLPEPNYLSANKSFVARIWISKTDGKTKRCPLTVDGGGGGGQRKDEIKI